MPSALVDACREDGRAAWLAGLPEEIEDVAARWSLTIGEPFEPGGVTAWVAPARSEEFGDVVLKVGWWHMEGESEAAGLREWSGEGAIRVFADERPSRTTTALLLERCTPGASLAAEPEEVQDVVIAGLLRRLWRRPADPTVFGTLQSMCDYWADAFERKVAEGRGEVDADLAREGAASFRSLPATGGREVLLCTDLHAQNVLAAQREPWLVIDPKPFVGDPTYDALQHCLNNEDRLRSDPGGLAGRLAGLLGLDAGRLLGWLFAYCVVQSVDFPWTLEVARRIRP
jgi:streptomycin 6-kinase